MKKKFNTGNWNSYFVVFLVGIAFGSLVLSILLEWEGDVINQETLDNICIEKFGNDYHQVSSYFILERGIRCVLKDEPKNLWNNTVYIYN